MALNVGFLAEGARDDEDEDGNLRLLARERLGCTTILTGGSWYPIGTAVGVGPKNESMSLCVQSANVRIKRRNLSVVESNMPVISGNLASETNSII